MNLCDFLGNFFAEKNVSHIFGMGGANIEDFFISLHQKQKTKVIICTHEANAVCMAMGAYLKTQQLGVVCTTSGGGYMNTLPLLAEAYASRIPVLVLAGQIPQELEGKGGFQDGSAFGPGPDVMEMTKPCSSFCYKLQTPEDILEILPFAYQKALETKRPVVLFIAKNLFQKNLNPAQAPTLTFPPSQPKSKQVKNTLEEMASLMKNSLGAKAPLAVIGEEFCHFPHHDLLQRFFEVFPCRVALTPLAKGLFDTHHPAYVGMTGIMGDESVETACAAADQVLLLGTSFDMMTRFGLDHLLEQKNVIMISEFEYPLRALVHGKSVLYHWEDLPQTLEKLITLLTPPPDQNQQTWPLSQWEPLPLPALPTDYHSTALMLRLNQFLPTDANIFVDAGNTGAFALHYLRPRGKGKFFLSLGMGAMGNALGAGMGSAMVSGERSHVILGDGSFFISGFELHTAVEHQVPLSLYIFNNNAHGMCSTREEVFFHQTTPLNNFMKTHIAKGIEQMFPQVMTFTIASIKEWEESLIKSEEDRKTHPQRIYVFDFELPHSEFPPFKTFAQKK